MQLTLERKLAFVVLLISLAIMGCWVFGQGSIYFAFPALYVVAFNTAVCLTLLSLCIFFLKNYSFPSTLYKWSASIIAIATGIVVLLQHAAIIPVVIDELLIKINVQDGVVPGRMSPITAVAFILGGMTILLYEFLSKRPIFTLATFSLFILTLIAVLGFIASFLHFDILYDMTRYGKMSPITALCFMALCASLWVHWYHSNLARRMEINLVDTAKFSFVAIIIVSFATTAALLIK